MSKQLIKQYITNQLVGEEGILRTKAYDVAGRKYLKRYISYRLERYIKDFVGNNVERRWIVIPGLRGAGKTTVLAQLYHKYKNIFQNKVLYISADDVVNKLNSNLYEIIDAYEEILGESYSRTGSKILLLFDEVQYDPKWAFALKSLYDRSRSVFILATGSSALSININTDIARRALIERMYPLKFTEYIMLSSFNTPNKKLYFPPKIGSGIKGAIFDSEDAGAAYQSLSALGETVTQYWRGVDRLLILKYLKYFSLPSVLTITDDSQIYQILNSIIRRIVVNDIALLRSFRKGIINKIEGILFMLAASDVTSLHSIVKGAEKIDMRTLRSIFDVLEKSELLIKVFPFGSAYKKARKPYKYLFNAPCLRASLLSTIDSKGIDLQYKGKLLEDAVGSSLSKDYGDKPGFLLSYDSSKKGADFIVQLGLKKVVIEVGWDKGTSEQIVRTLRHVKGDYGVLITNRPLHLNVEERIITVPLEYFFLV